MSILITRPGILTTVQDLGRYGLRRYGINPNGAMDKAAVRLINLLLASDENAPVLEMHFPAPEILFEENAVFALGGANFSAELDGQPIASWRPYFAPRQSLLKFTRKISGSRAYLAVRRGFRIEPRLGSASTNLKAGFGGLRGGKLQTGDRLPFRSERSLRRTDFDFMISASLIPHYSSFPTVRIVAGAEFGLLTPESRENLWRENFTITQNSDRMGFRLSGTALQMSEERELVSSAVNFGTIQRLPDGQLIVLMADHQTTGGYPRIGSVAATDLPILAQLGTNDKVAFHRISTADDEALWLQFENDLKRLRAASRFRY